MRLPFTVALSLCCLIMMAQSSKSLFDFEWKFYEGEAVGAETVNFDDSKWQAVNLPHDWDICHAPVVDAPSGNDGGYYPGGTGWYRKVFKTPSLTSHLSSIALHFEGVYQRCKVYVNGKLAGTHGYGYTPFSIDITPYIIKGGRQLNYVAVYVDNSLQPNCRWYSGSGIYRHVWLETFEKDAIDNPAKLFVRTERIYGMSADGTHADSAKVRISYEGRPDEIRSFHNIYLWSPKNPKLYDIKVGKLTVRHGFRTFEYSAEKGAVLNGQKILINGACVHHDDGILGAMAFDKAEIRKVREMKDAGFNLIRTSHNPTTRAFIDACDSIGMMVISEFCDNWYSKKTKGDYALMIDSCWQSDLSSLVLRDRNHPSVICWSIGNEVIERKEIRVIQTARKFKKLVNSLDPTRPVTEALCSWDKDWEIFDPHAEVLDIVGYNYMMHKAESDHERQSERVMWQTESYPRDAFKNWKHTVERPYIIGDIVWTGLDYLGESGIGQFYYNGEPRGEHYNGKHFPFHGAYCGDVDMTGWRKPISHYRDMLWNTSAGEPAEPYMAVKEPDGYANGRISETLWSVWPTWESWNWKGWEGKPIEVEVYTKSPSVKLYLNDKLIDTKAVSEKTEYKAVFKIPYQPGTLRAESAVGKCVKLVTTGKATAIRLTPDSRTIKADGQDLAFIIAEAVDNDGNVVPDASETFNVEVKGAATFLAAGSASFKDLEPMTSTKVTTYKGRAMIVVRATQKAGAINVKVRSNLAVPTTGITLKSVK